MFDEDEQKIGAEEHVMGLQEVASPDLRSGVSPEGGPRMPSVLRWHLPPSLMYVAADDAAVDP